MKLPLGKVMCAQENNKLFMSQAYGARKYFSCSAIYSERKKGICFRENDGKERRACALEDRGRRLNRWCQNVILAKAGTLFCSIWLTRKAGSQVSGDAPKWDPRREDDGPGRGGLLAPTMRAPFAQRTAANH